MSFAHEQVSKERLDLQELKELLAGQLRDADNLKRPEGLATGFTALDRFLFWGGIPKGALSLFRGALGTGATSLWIEAAARVIRENRWVAWIDSEVPLAPLSLYHKGLSLERFVAIEAPPTESKLFWLLQELMSSSLFEMIGCDLGAKRLKEHQLRKLQAQARDAHVALSFLAQGRRYQGSSATVFSLILSFEKRCVQVERALHRPTPQSFPRSVTYARFTVHTGDRIVSGSSTAPAELAEHAQPEPSPLPTASR